MINEYLGEQDKQAAKQDRVYEPRCLTRLANAVSVFLFKLALWITYPLFAPLLALDILGNRRWGILPALYFFLHPHSDGKWAGAPPLLKASIVTGTYLVMCCGLVGGFTVVMPAHSTEGAMELLCVGFPTLACLVVLVLACSNILQTFNPHIVYPVSCVRFNVSNLRKQISQFVTFFQMCGLCFTHSVCEHIIESNPDVRNEPQHNTSRLPIIAAHLTHQVDLTRHPHCFTYPPHASPSDDTPLLFSAGCCLRCQHQEFRPALAQSVHDQTRFYDQP